MAKGKGKKVSSGGPRKPHGPKKHLHKDYKPMIKAFADCGLLTKFNDYESWCIACNARGKRITTKEEFKDFSALSLEKKKEYFKSLRK